MIQMDRILAEAAKTASDLHIKVGMPPYFRVEGELKPLDTEPVTKEIMMSSVIPFLLSEKQRSRFDDPKEDDIDCSRKIGVKEQGERRFRVNAAHDMNGPYVALRVIPESIRDIREVGFPLEGIWEDITSLESGLVLVTGVTGSGKTTTLASLIQEINRTQKKHIVTIEDPIEYVHKPEKSLVSQRELGSDVRTFDAGIKYALRQDPDVILVGEIRDVETARETLEAADTGHLVFSTLHTGSAAESVRRYISLFESSDHDYVIDALTGSLAYVISQRLIPPRAGETRTLAMEIMNPRVLPGIANNLKKGEYRKVHDAISTSRARGMITMDQHLMELCKAHKISAEGAVRYAHDREQVRSQLGKNNLNN